jgi:hypothetical protein
MTAAQRRKHDIAYGCFFPPVTACLAELMANTIPGDTSTAAGVGFFLLIPLTMVALVTIPVESCTPSCFGEMASCRFLRS